MKFGVFENLKLEFLYHPAGYVRYGNHHPQFARAFLCAFWALHGDSCQDMREEDIPLKGDPDAHVKKKIRARQFQSNFASAIAKAADRLQHEWDTAHSQDDGVGVSNINEWLAFVEMAYSTVFDHPSIVTRSLLAVLILHSVDAAISELARQQIPPQLAICIGMSVQQAVNAAELEITRLHVDSYGRQESARKAAFARHKKTSEIRNFVLETWKERGTEYRSRSAFARDMTQKVDIQDPRTIMKWLGEDDA